MNTTYLSLQEFEQGTAGFTHVHEIVGGLRELGVSVDLHVPHYRRTTSSIVTRAWVMLGLQFRLATKWLFGSKPDVLYVRHHFVALPITILARLFGIPVVVEVNGPADDFIVSWSIPPLLASIVRQTAYWQCRLGDWVIGVTPGLVELLSTKYGVAPDRISFVSNGVNTQLFRLITEPDLSAWPNIGDKKFVIFVGALLPWQSINIMLQAITCPQWPDDVTLIIAGDGLLREDVERQRMKQLIYINNIPYDHVPRFISASIAGLCLINDQTRAQTGVSPLKLFEYAACSRPAIVTDMQGLSDFVSNSNCGIVIPCDDPVALCEAVRKIDEDPVKREAMGKAGAEYVRQGYSWQDKAKETLDILQRVAK